MTYWMRRALCLLLVLLIGACAGGKVNERAPLAQRIFDLAQEGQAAYLKGDLPRARRLFELALNDAMRIEDSEGVVAMAINLARVARESGAVSDALARLDALSAWHRSAIPAPLDSEVDLLSAVLLADLGRLDAALLRLGVLREKFGRADGLSIGADSLQARLVLEKGDARQARDLAGAALARFREHDNRQEFANLLRVHGEASLSLGDFSVARLALEEALGIDKALAQATKVALDLEALVRTTWAAQDRAAHARYRERLDDVMRAQLSRAPK